MCSVAYKRKSICLKLQTHSIRDFKITTTEIMLKRRKLVLRTVQYISTKSLDFVHLFLAWIYVDIYSLVLYVYTERWSLEKFFWRRKIMPILQIQVYVKTPNS
jgi:hypothetical protein